MKIQKKAVWREMMEEIGTNNATLLQTSSQWINYNIPKDTLATLPWGKKIRRPKHKNGFFSGLLVKIKT